MEVILTKVAIIATCMLILNMIVEKIVSFWKLNGPSTLRSSNSDSELEKIREMKISNASLIIGILIALFLKVDFVELITNPNPEQTFGWELIVKPDTEKSISKPTSGNLINDMNQKDSLSNTFTPQTIKYYDSLIVFDNASAAIIVKRLLIILSLLISFISLLVFIAKREESSDSSNLKNSKFLWNKLSLSIKISIVSLTISLILLISVHEWLFFYRYFCIFISAIFAGAGISFGSKFWHDLLDVVYQLKNFNNKISDKNTYDSKTIDQLNDYINLDKEDIIRKAIDEKRVMFRKYPNVVGLGIGYKESHSFRSKEPCIRFYVNKKMTNPVEVSTMSQNNQLIPPFIEYSLMDGKSIEILTDVVDVGIVKTCSVNPGTGIQNYDPIYDGAGTMGCIVYDKETGGKMIMTCYHVVNAGHNWEEFAPLRNNKDYIRLESTNRKLAKIVQGKVFDNVDIALALPEKEYEHQIINFIDHIGVPKNIAKISKGLEILFKGKTLPTAKSGIIIDEISEIDILYPDDKSRTLNKLISISTRINNENFAVAQGGDSGALVINNNSEAVGVVVAGSDNFTYVIPFENIVENFGITLEKPSR